MDQQPPQYQPPPGYQPPQQPPYGYPPFQQPAYPQYQPPMPGVRSGATHGSSTVISSLGSDTMAGIIYLLSMFSLVGMILQIVIIAMEKNRYVKFHAVQAITITVVALVSDIAVLLVFLFLSVGATAYQSSPIGASAPYILLPLDCLLGLLLLTLFSFWIWGMVTAFTGRDTRLPVIGSFAERVAGGAFGITP